MTVILCIAVIVVVVVLISQNSKINKLIWENNQLRGRLDELWTMFQQHNRFHPSASAPPPAAPPGFQPPSPTVQPPVYAPPPPVRPMPVTPPPVVPPPAAALYTSPIPAARPPYPIPVPQPAVCAAPSRPTATGTPGRMENWFGRNVLGIAASVLFFVGLIVFAVWIYNDIPETVKILLMYAISTAVTAAGILLTVRRRNPFTLILSGCGCGLLFISILLTHVYFGRFNDVTTFSLLLLWLAAALVLARQLNSTLISLVAHIGMGVSLCFAYAAGLHDDKLVTLLLYQAASIVVIVVGNILCCQKTYRFGLFLSVVMTLVAGAFMTARFIGTAEASAGAFPLSVLPDWAIAASFFAQFLCVSCLSYLLAVSTTRLENDHVRMGIHVANKVLWIASLSLNVLPVVFRLAYAYSEGMTFRPVFAVGIMAAVGLALLLLHALLSMVMSTALGFDGRLETLSVLLAGGLSAVLLIIVWASCLLAGTPMPRLPLILLPAVLLLLAGWRLQNRAYRLASDVLLGLDWILMALSGFHELTRFGTVALPLFYMLLYAGLAWLQWFRNPPETRQASSPDIRLFLYLFLQVTALVILAGSGYRYWHVGLLLALMGFNCLLILFRYDRGENRMITYGMRTVEGILLAAGAGLIAFMPRSAGPDPILYAILAVFTGLYAFFRTPFTLGRTGSAEDVCTGVKFTLLSLALIQGFTSWFDTGYALTVAALATLLPCLAAGYARKARGLTLYALIASMPCILKLLCFDVPFLAPLPRLIALLSGSALFFAVHLLYDRLDDKTVPALTSLFRSAQHLILAASAAVIAFSPHSGTVQTTLCILLTVLSFVWAFMWIPRTLGRTSRSEAVLEGVKLTVLVLATVHGYTDWFANAYVLSLVCMLTALICIIAGFLRRAGSLRLYGLVLTMICVLKLVTWDVAGLETLLRILSLIGGGVICFAISAIYSYSVKHLSPAAVKEEGTAGLSGRDNADN